MIGAHPGYADREGFGRREQKLTTLEVIDLIGSQIAVLMKPRIGGGRDGSLLEAARCFVQPGAGASRRLPARWSRPHGRWAGRYSGSREAFSRARRGITAWFTSRRASRTGVTAATDRSCRAASRRPCCMNRTRSRSKSIRLVSEGRVATLCIHGDEPAAVATATVVRRVAGAAGNCRPIIREWFGLMGIVVVDPGLFTTVQDAGRPGYAAWGVSAGGAFDRGSADLANAFLGNSPDCAVLEMALVGGTYQADCVLAMALAGAPIEARIVQTDCPDQPLRVPTSFTLREGRGSC